MTGMVMQWGAYIIRDLLASFPFNEILNKFFNIFFDFLLFFSSSCFNLTFFSSFLPSFTSITWIGTLSMLLPLLLNILDEYFNFFLIFFFSFLLFPLDKLSFNPSSLPSLLYLFYIVPLDEIVPLWSLTKWPARSCHLIHGSLIGCFR